MLDLKRILLPVDYSEHSRQTLLFAAGLAKQLGAAIDVLHVAEYPLRMPGDINVVQGGKKRPLGELLLENAEREMEEFLRSPEPQGVPISHKLNHGEPAGRILSAIEAGHYDLVVIGTHGRTGFQHWLLGSVAERVLRLSPVAVLTFPWRSRESA